MNGRRPRSVTPQNHTTPRLCDWFGEGFCKLDTGHCPEKTFVRNVIKHTIKLTSIKTKVRIIALALTLTHTPYTNTDLIPDLNTYTILNLSLFYEMSSLGNSVLPFKINMN